MYTYERENIVPDILFFLFSYSSMDPIKTGLRERKNNNTKTKLLFSSS